MKTEHKPKTTIRGAISYQEHLLDLKKRKPEAYKALKDPEPLACLAFNIIDLRGKKGWSQHELANHADVAPRMITYIESFSDKANTSVKVVQRIAKALGVSFNRLFEIVDLTKV